MTKNATDSILMIRPARFIMNEETAVDNFYQQKANLSQSLQNEQAQKEFDLFVQKLRSIGVAVYIIQDTPEPHTPDSIFPNNWISMHDDGRVVLYPMKAENRRKERITDITKKLQQFGFITNETVDYSPNESKGVFLEGTGAMIFDHDTKIVYMARSQRADTEMLQQFCDDFKYQPVVFGAYQTTPNGRLPIYHTNVMMCVTDKYVVICLDTIDDFEERKLVIDTIEKSGKEVIEITESQKHLFAGNMLLVKGRNDQLHLVMSERARKSLREDQVQRIKAHHTILSCDLTTIEDLGGGSARCMLAEIYLPKKAIGT